MNSEHVNLTIKRLDEDVELPRYAYPGDAGLDQLGLPLRYQKATRVLYSRVVDSP